VELYAIEVYKHLSDVDPMMQLFVYQQLWIYEDDLQENQGKDNSLTDFQMPRNDALLLLFRTMQFFCFDQNVKCTINIFKYRILRM